MNICITRMIDKTKKCFNYIIMHKIFGYYNIIIHYYKNYVSILTGISTRFLKYAVLGLL